MTRHRNFRGNVAGTCGIVLTSWKQIFMFGRSRWHIEQFILALSPKKSAEHTFPISWPSDIQIVQIRPVVFCACNTSTPGLLIGKANQKDSQKLYEKDLSALVSAHVVSAVLIRLGRCYCAMELQQRATRRQH